jgi:hypothetical protein
MTPDPMAVERLRTLLTDAIRETGYTAAGMGVDADPEVAAGKVLDSFPVAHFARWTNENDVPMRRLVIASEDEMDPSRTRPNPPTADEGSEAERHLTSRMGGMKDVLTDLIEAFRNDPDAGRFAPEAMVHIVAKRRGIVLP